MTRSHNVDIVTSLLARLSGTPPTLKDRALRDAFAEIAGELRVTPKELLNAILAANHIYKEWDLFENDLLRREAWLKIQLERLGLEIEYEP